MKDVLSEAIVFMTVAGGTLYFLENTARIAIDVAGGVDKLLHTKTFKLSDEEYSTLKKAVKNGDDYEKEVAFASILKDEKRGWMNAEWNDKKKTVKIVWVKKDDLYKAKLERKKFIHDRFNEMEKEVMGLLEAPKPEVKAEEKPHRVTKAEKKQHRSDAMKLAWKNRKAKEQEIERTKGKGYLARVRNLRKARRARRIYSRGY